MSHPSICQSRTLTPLVGFSRQPAALACCLMLCGILWGGTSGAEDSSLSELEPAEAQMEAQLEEAQQLEEEAQQLRAAQQTEEKAAREADAKALADKRAAETKSREEKILSEIEREDELESELSLRQERNERATVRDALGAHALDSQELAEPVLANARAAPPTPTIRDLPRPIFERSKVSIPAHQWGNAKKLKLLKLVLDADRDGRPEVIRFVDAKSDQLIRQEEDRNYDGTLDVVSEIEGNHIFARSLDSNDDGRTDSWETFREGRMVMSKIDRDYDGVVDAHFEYQGRFLNRERHDANNDGKIDLTIEYREGHRFKAEEDRDRDGRSDTWTLYGIVEGFETVIRIERDEKGRGYADTFESFESHDGKAVISRREEDVDGDGEIDMISIYRLGKLVRREILKPEVVAL